MTMPVTPLNKENFLVGVISDTHGLLRPEVPKVFNEVDIILHAGDIDGPPVLDALRKIAPLTAVQGNMDHGEWSRALPPTEVAEIGAALVYMLHNVYALDIDPAVSGFHAVISGHTHRPSVEMEKGVLFLNPGSAGPRRNKVPASVALLHVQGTALDARIITLKN